jgi:hypothetical protein
VAGIGRRGEMAERINSNDIIKLGQCHTTQTG